MPAMSLEELLPMILSGGRAGPGFRAPTPVVPASTPIPRPRPSIFQAGPMAQDTPEPEVPVPGQRPSLGTVIPAEAPATRPTLRSRAGDYFRDVAGGVGAASQIDNPLGAFLAGIGGSVETDKARQAAAAELARAEEDRLYQRGRDTKSDQRAEEEFGLTKRVKEAEIAEGERKAKNPLTPQVLLDIEERAAAYAKSLGLYDASFPLEGPERDAALAAVREYRQGLREEIGRTGELPAEAAPTKDQSQLAPPAEAPPVGTVEDGYRFLGGDPSLPESWERVQ